MERAIREYLDHCSDVKRYSPHTIAAYGNDLSQFHEFLLRHGSGAPVDLNGIDRLTIRLFLGDLLERGASKTSAARKLSSVRSFLDAQVRRGALANYNTHSIAIRLPITQRVQVPKTTVGVCPS